MAAYRRVYDSRHLQADCQELGSAPELYAPLIEYGLPLPLLVWTSSRQRASWQSHVDKTTLYTADSVLFRFMNRPVISGFGLYDPTSIMNASELNRAYKEGWIKLAFYILLFFYYIYGYTVASFLYRAPFTTDWEIRGIGKFRKQSGSLTWGHGK